MPADGIEAKKALAPNGMKPPTSMLLLLNLNARMMMARTGIATFHHVMAELTRLNSLTARKLMAVNSAIRTIVITKPIPVTLPVVESYRPCQAYDPYCITAKHSIGATVTACTQEKKPNEMPATLPNAKCGNLAVPPATGYIPPSSAWTRARTMIMAPPMHQARRAPVPVEYEAFHAPNSQPDPMIEVTDAQVAPTRPISRRRPMSPGRLVVGTASVAMSNPFRSAYVGHAPAIRGAYTPRVDLMVMIDTADEKKELGVISITRTKRSGQLAAGSGLRR